MQMPSVPSRSTISAPRKLHQMDWRKYCSDPSHRQCHSIVLFALCRYIPRDASMTSETFYCKRGVNQLFLQSSHIFNPTLYPDDLSYNPDVDVYPIAIHCVVDEGPEENRQSHTTICVVDHHSDGTYGLRALKQKIFVDGLCYLLQEIYGIENKNITKVSTEHDLLEDTMKTTHFTLFTDKYRRRQRRQFKRMCYLHEWHSRHTDSSMSTLMFV